MFASPARRSRVLIIGLLALGLGACSARKIAYRMAPTLLMSAADDMLELTSAQKEWLRPELRALVAWHRREELKGWAAALDELRRRLGDGLQPDDVKWTRTTTASLVFRVARKVAPVGGELFSRLQPRQLDHARQAVREERRKRGGDDRGPERAIDKQVKDRVKSLERWTGPLTSAQRDLVAEHLRRTASDTQLRRALDNDRWSAFIDAQRAPQPVEARTAALLDLLTRQHPDTLPPPSPGSPAARLTVAEMKTLYDRIEAMNDEFAVRLFQTITPAQRARLDAELLSLRDDMLELAKD